jgi:hypothetical protein
LNIEIKEDAIFSASSGKVDKKLSKGTFTCTCKLFKGHHCSSYFSVEDLFSLRMEHLEMEKNILDHVILLGATFTGVRRPQNKRKNNRHAVFAIVWTIFLKL